MDADREFHDALFSPQQYDPFTFAYPGYLTIRRFADLAAERLTGVRRAADLGIHAVPTFVVGEQPAMSGAQPPEALAEVVRRALARS